jgi:iron only hydrogenase large subunit-like protein/anti-sigma regulatory factor (Ser/Thr protein kinase)
MAIPPDRRLLCQFELNKGDFRRIGDEFFRLKRALLGIGFPSDASRRALIAAYELSMNIIIHAHKGCLAVSWSRGALSIEARDEGPGIPDIDLAMKDGYSTAPDYVREMGYGAGMGLPNAKQSSDNFSIQSQVGLGTTVSCVVSPGPQDAGSVSFFHSVRLETARCKGCTNCIKGCPTEAIRVRRGKAFILEDRCIDCGECVRRCPNQAKYVVHGSWDDLSQYDYKIGLVPPSFCGQFGDMTQDEVRAALTVPGGFDEVFDVAIAADLVSSVMKEYISEHQGGGPFISAACPAVVRLIQVKYPSLLKKLIPCEAPMEVAAWLVKESPRNSKRPAKVTAVFISPCPAKITASRQPVGRGFSLVDTQVSVMDAYRWVQQHREDALGALASPGTSTGLGMGWGRSGGEMSSLGHSVKGLAVDGVDQVASVLDEVEKGKLTGQVDFIEAQACVGGCVGGCLNIENPFIARVRIRELAVKHKDSPANPIIRGISGAEPEVWFSLGLNPRAIFTLDADPKKAGQKLLDLEKVESELPGLDCGACGAPTCRALAEDVVLGRGSVMNCTFKLRDRLEALANEVRELATMRPPAMAEPSDSRE